MDLPTSEAFGASPDGVSITFFSISPAGHDCVLRLPRVLMQTEFITVVHCRVLLLVLGPEQKSDFKFYLVTIDNPQFLWCVTRVHLENRSDCKKMPRAAWSGSIRFEIGSFRGPIHRARHYSGNCVNPELNPHILAGYQERGYTNLQASISSHNGDKA